ncbi:MAG: metallopeptidase family protein [Nitriliruptorales bacterium]
MDDRHARHRRPDADRRQRPSEGFRIGGVRRFERLVDNALASLPGTLLAYVENVQIAVENDPPPEALDRGDGILLGLYQGVPLTARASDAVVLPDRITLYRRPIELRATNKEELLDLIREVVIHELAHHFGIDDDRLDELGW